MTREDIGRGIIGCVGGVDAASMKTAPEEDWTLLLARMTGFPAHLLHVEDQPFGPDELAAMLHARFAVQAPGLLVVDYLQNMRPPRGAKNQEERVAGCVKAVKELAMIHRVPCILVSQVNREVGHRNGKGLVLSDLRGSGTIEQACDAVIFLWPDGEDGDLSKNRIVAVKVAKHRGGRTGMTRLHFFPRQTRFASCVAPAREQERGQSRAEPDSEDLPL